jgi:hypothetical protein
MVQQTHTNAETCLPQSVPHDWARLIAKLRWIGLEEEAKKLELALRTLPPEERCGVSFGPFNTD